jgi:hypothetical protein
MCNVPSFPDLAVEQFPKYVEMTDMAGVFLEDMKQDRDQRRAILGIGARAESPAQNLTLF